MTARYLLDGEPLTAPLETFLTESDLGDDQAKRARELRPGESMLIGGGASATFTLARVDAAPSASERELELGSAKRVIESCREKHGFAHSACAECIRDYAARLRADRRALRNALERGADVSLREENAELLDLIVGLLDLAHDHGDWHSPECGCDTCEVIKPALSAVAKAKERKS